MRVAQSYLARRCSKNGIVDKNAFILCRCPDISPNHPFTARSTFICSAIGFVEYPQICSKYSGILERTRDARQSFAATSATIFLCIVEQLFNELSTLKDSDRFIPSHMHLTLYRLCEDWCQLGPQLEMSKKRIEIMQRTIESVERDAGQRFRHEMALLSHASVGALTALCVRYLPLSFL